MAFQIFRNGAPVDYPAEWWSEDPRGDLAREIEQNGYHRSFDLGAGAGAPESFLVEVYSSNHSASALPNRPPYLIVISLCAHIECIFAPDMWSALQLLQQLAPLATATLLTDQQAERDSHMEKHARKRRWDDYCFWCQHERRVSQP